MTDKSKDLREQLSKLKGEKKPESKSKKVAEAQVTKPVQKQAPRKTAAKRKSGKSTKTVTPLNVNVNKGHRYQPGNRFWELRSSHGRKPIFSSPEQLWNAATEYFQWVEDNPLMETKLFAYQGVVHEGVVAKMRAMTIQGMCIYLDISTQGWREYKAKPDFSAICEAVESVIYQQKFAGASADLLNASIIARELGLADKSELTGKDGAPIETVTKIELVPAEKP